MKPFLRLRQDLLRLIALWLVPAGVAVGVNAVRSGGLPLWAAVQEAPGLCTASESATILEIEASEARTLISENKAVLFDARPSDDFARGHIPGAKHLPCSGEPAFQALRGKERIIVYDEGSGAHSHEVASAIARRGFDVRILKGGFRAWGQGGGALESGSCVDCALTAGHESRGAP